MHTALKLMVVALLTLFLASGVGVIYFFFQNMALGLELEEQEKEISNLEQDLAKKNEKISDLSAKLSEYASVITTQTISATPGDLHFTYTGERIYGKWVIERTMASRGGELIDDKFEGHTDGVNRVDLVKHEIVSGRGGYWGDIDTWKKEGGKYFVQFGESFLEVPANYVVEEVALSTGSALILRGIDVAEMSVFPGSDTKFLAIVQSGRGGVSSRALHFTVSKNSAMQQVDFVAFVKSIGY